jgi:hypothetical protein
MLSQSTASLPEKPLCQGIFPPGQGGDCGIGWKRTSLDALDLIGQLDREVREPTAKGSPGRVTEGEASLREGRRIPGAGAGKQTQGLLKGGGTPGVRAVAQGEPGQDGSHRPEGEATKPKASSSIRTPHCHQQRRKVTESYHNHAFRRKKALAVG